LGTSYTYQVRRYNAARTSGYSRPGTATPHELAAPTNLVATTVSASEIDLAWTDNSDNEDGFRIERCSGAGCTNFFEIATVGANVTTYHNTSLLAATSYSYRVRAYNGAGPSAYSNTATATTPPCNCWSTRTSMPTPRSGLAAGVVNGTLYAVGGNYTTGPVEAYDPITDMWRTKAPLPTWRYGLGVGIVNGILYAVGGYSGGAVGTLEAYDPATDTWTTRASMPTARDYVAVGVVNGILYAVGGSSPSPTGTALATLEAYDPATDTWTTKPSMPTARTALAAGVFNGILYAVGGYVANSLATL